MGQEVHSICDQLTEKIVSGIFGNLDSLHRIKYGILKMLFVQGKDCYVQVSLPQIVVLVDADVKLVRRE